MHTRRREAYCGHGHHQPSFCCRPVSARNYAAWGAWWVFRRRGTAFASVQLYSLDPNVKPPLELRNSELQYGRRCVLLIRESVVAFSWSFAVAKLLLTAVLCMCRIVLSFHGVVRNVFHNGAVDRASQMALRKVVIRHVREYFRVCVFTAARRMRSLSRCPASARRVSSASFCNRRLCAVGHCESTNLHFLSTGS